MANVTINQLPVASTIDGVQDLLPIFTNSSTSTQAISRNTLLGLSSAPVGLTDTQTLTNKTLTSPTINGATLSGTLSGTYTIGGTPTFPAAVATLTGTQTLTNKTLTSPTINAPTITNATLSSDSITGFTTSTNGSIFGMSVTGGILASAALANTVNSAALQTGAVVGASIATNAIKLGYASVTAVQSSISTLVDLTGLATTVTVPAGGRDVKITAQCHFIFSQGITVGCSLNIKEGSTVLQSVQGSGANTTNAFTITCITRLSAPAAGSHTYKLNAGFTSGTGSMYADSSGYTGYILVEAI